jgi:putative zinc finger/helix-turn-helix YgiT family protein
MGHGPMELQKLPKKITFRGVDITYTADAFVCLACGLEAGTVKSAGAIQKSIADAYRTKRDLLTGEEIKELRKAKGLTQQGLANLMNVGIASVKRWETGLIQSKSMDRALRIYLQGSGRDDIYSGNRALSIPRIKLVIGVFETALRKRLLKKTDKMLFAAKYLWYADMLAYKKLGRSMTGAQYAALPYGPQINNYRDLIDEIKNARESSAEPLTEDEKRLIEKIVKAFPYERLVYDAAHREVVWKKISVGAPILYTAASKLTEIK